MSCNLQLQRNSEIFVSTVDLNGGAAVATMTPANTWKVEVLAGYAVSQAAATTDITALESGTTPDRSSTRFNTALNAVEWSWDCYIRPTGVDSVSANYAGGSTSCNSKPVADWFLWQALMSNTNPASGAYERSVWQDGGKFDSTARGATANVSPHTSNFGSAQENYIYIKMDNIVYQVSQASVNQAEISAAIDSIATTKWSGFGTTITELTGVKRNNAISVFGGTLNNGTLTDANSNAYALTAASAYHPWDQWNVAGTLTTASFIKNRLSSIDLYHTPEGGAAVNYTFPVTSLSLTYNNNITFLTPEELSALNTPIGNFAGARQISGSLTAYLRHNTGDTAQLLRNIVNDTRVSHSAYANANIKIGGATAPFFAAYLPATQFDIPVHAVEDIISVNIGFQAQESSASCGNGGEIVLFADK